MNTIQQQFNSNNSNDFVLSIGEYEGPLTIDRPCTIDGSKSTLWANNGPVLIINSTGVTVKNLRVECTGQRNNNESPVAITTSANDTKLINVEVNGNIKGFPNEPETWSLPTIISLGDFAANAENTFCINLKAAYEAEIINNMSNVTLSPTKLYAGSNIIKLTTDKFRNNTIIYGEIFIKSTVTRRLYITGRASHGSPVHSDSEPASTESTVSLPDHAEVPNEVIAPVVSTAVTTDVQRGQRLSVKELESKLLKIVYEHKSVKQSIEIDSYLFMLQKNGKVQNDDSLIFFGKNESSDGSIKSSTVDNKCLTMIELSKIESWVNKIVVCYSIYGNDPKENFSLVEKPTIRIMDENQELYRFALSELDTEKTVVALEIYRYKGEWKINFIGAGYNSGLKLLCESYGVNVV